MGGDLRRAILLWDVCSMALNAAFFAAALCVLTSHARQRRSRRRLAGRARTRWDTKTSVLAQTLAALALRLTWLVNPGFYEGEIFVPHFAWGDDRGGSSGDGGGGSAGGAGGAGAQVGTGAGDAVLAVSGVRFLLWKLPHFLRLAAYTTLVFFWREQAQLVGRAVGGGGGGGGGDGSCAGGGTAAKRKSREIGILRSMKRFLGAALLADAALVTLAELNVGRAWADRGLNMLSFALAALLVGHGALYARALREALVVGGGGGGDGAQQQQRSGAARGTSAAVAAFVRRVQLVVRVSGGAIGAQAAAYLYRHAALPYSWGEGTAAVGSQGTAAGSQGAAMGAPDHWGFFWFLTVLTLSELLFAWGLVLAVMRPSSRRGHRAAAGGGGATPAAASALAPEAGGGVGAHVRVACPCLSWGSCRGSSGGSGEGVLRMAVTRESELGPRPSSLRVGSEEVARQPRLSSGRVSEGEGVGERSSEAALTGFPGGGSGSAQGEALRVTAVALPDSMQDSARVSV
jgi:hypothetical protein